VLRRFRRRRTADAAYKASHARWNQPLPAVVGDEAVAKAQRERLRQLQEYKATEPILRPAPEPPATNGVLRPLLATLADVIEATKLLEALPRYDDNDPRSSEWAQGHARLAMRLGSCGVRLDALAEQASADALDHELPAPVIALEPLLVALEDVLESMKLLKALPRFDDNDPRSSEWANTYGKLAVLLGGLILRLEALIEHASAGTSPGARSKRSTPTRPTRSRRWRLWRAQRAPERP